MILVLPAKEARVREAAENGGVGAGGRPGIHKGSDGAGGADAAADGAGGPAGPLRPQRRAAQAAYHRCRARCQPLHHLHVGLALRCPPMPDPPMSGPQWSPMPGPQCLVRNAWSPMPRSSKPMLGVLFPDLKSCDGLVQKLKLSALTLKMRAQGMNMAET